ncbi:hypothetical protein Taro_044155 [Colocasia esculenta]|uniref:Uncharacterized protein n=1 Tax=Colocasia esculenta TaxID=4460 RepID=A0A843WTA4_COLES|nr:hypothetical protein [Colocasia esculenta]
MLASSPSNPRPSPPPPPPSIYTYKTTRARPHSSQPKPPPLPLSFSVKPSPMAPASLHSTHKTVCVMDAAGRVGAAVAERLLQRGYTVHAATQGDPRGLLKLLPSGGDAGKRLKVFWSDPFDYPSLLDAMKGCSGLFYSFEPPPEQPSYDKLATSPLAHVATRYSSGTRCAQYLPHGVPQHLSRFQLPFTEGELLVGSKAVPLCAELAVTGTGEEMAMHRHKQTHKHLKCVLIVLESFHHVMILELRNLDSQLMEHMVEVEVRAAHNVLEACAHTETLEKVVFTSSVTAVVWTENRRLAAGVDERNWSEPQFCQKFKLWHALAKTLAEKTAWALAMDRDVNMVTINVGLLTGSGLSIANPYLKGAAEMYDDGVLVTADDRFLADAHICVFEDSTSFGRYLCFNHVICCPNDAVDFAKMIAPAMPHLPSSDGLKTIPQRIQCKKLNKFMVDFDSGLAKQAVH